ncbi:MAG: PcfJ domain-containing protein [Neomegalonema sp.]|nr:PcfJ domain-containing protein [Neomegalonema sp.]
MRPPISAPHLEQLRRYHRRLQSQLEATAQIHPALADLLSSFPAAIVMLALRAGPPATRGEAVFQARQGASLAQIAEALDLPYWTRRLPPEAFIAPIDLRREDRDDENFGRQLLPTKPASPRAIGLWLNWVHRARQFAGDEFALWLAKQPVFRAPRSPLAWGRLPATRALDALALYALASQIEEQGPDFPLPPPFTLRMGFGAACDNALDWIHALTQDLICEGVYGCDFVQSPRMVDGIAFVPLHSRADLCAEARAMRNCLETYADRVRCGICRIVSLRKDGSSIATLELSAYNHDALDLAVHNLMGRQNSVVSAYVDSAVQRWLEWHNRIAAMARPLAAENEKILPGWQALRTQIGALSRKHGLARSPLLAIENPRGTIDALRIAAWRLSAIRRYGNVNV